MNLKILFGNSVGPVSGHYRVSKVDLEKFMRGVVKEKVL